MACESVGKPMPDIAGLGVNYDTRTSIALADLLSRFSLASLVRLLSRSLSHSGSFFFLVMEDLRSAFTRGCT